MEIPSFEINSNDLENLIAYLLQKEEILKEFGAIKLQLNINCQLSLKTKQRNIQTNPSNDRIRKINENQSIYFIEKVDQIQSFPKANSFGKDELQFWSSLSSCEKTPRSTNISILPNESLFSSKTCFSLAHLPKQSILQEFVPHLHRSHSPSSIFPLTSVNQGLLAIHYHHQGGNHHYYFLTKNQRKYLEKLIEKTICLDHGEIFVDPSVLDKAKIKYSRTIQHQNQFIVLASGTFYQAFTEDQSWTESIHFTLTNLIKDLALPSCTHIQLFNEQIIEKYLQNEILNSNQTSIEDIIDDEDLLKICSSSSFNIDDDQTLFDWSNSFDFHSILNEMNSSPILTETSKRIFLSHLPIEITNQQLRRYFPLARKILFKKNYWNNKFRFALIEHRNCLDAQRNLDRFINSPPSNCLFFGVQARYAKDKQIKSKSSSKVRQSTSDLYVGQIPGFVTRNQLEELFPQATSIDYRQGSIKRERVKFGFAFLHFNDIISANNIIKHSKEYFISNQRLNISYQFFNEH